jgi:AcrR family transcriptional regulator
MLVDHGIDAVRVDVLARQMGVTRGSFYWHFKDRDQLLQCVLHAWKTFATDQVIERFESSRADPRAMLKELISLPFRGKTAARTARVELAIRAWARSDAVARQAVDEVDARRIAFHAQVFSALGFSIPEARARATVLYDFEVAESLLSAQGSEAQKAERRALIERLILLRLPSSREA